MKRLKLGLPNTLLATAITALAGLCSGVILAQTLSPSARGEFAAILLWPNAVAILGEIGLGFSFSYFVVRDNKRISGLCTLALAVSLIWGGLLALTGVLIFPAMLHLSPVANSCLLWNFITVPISLLTGYSAYFLLGSNYVFEFNMARLVITAAYTLGIVVVALMHYASVNSFTFIYILSQVIGCLVSICLVILRLKPVLNWQPDLLKPVFIYGGKTYLSSLSAQLNLRLDQLLMSSIIGVKELGLYVISVSFSSMIMPLFTALAVVVLPRTTNAADLKKGGEQIIRCFQLGLVLGLPVMIIAVVSAPWLLPYLFSQKYMLSVFPAQILLAAAIFQGLNILLGNGLRGLGQPGKTAISEGAGLIVTAILLVWLLPAYGALGAAIASLCAYLLVTGMQLFFVKQAAGLEWNAFYTFSFRILFPDMTIYKRKTEESIPLLWNRNK